ncbi:hypothetical protein AURDEDRAFT_113626 [Auricularia subglabra TFB-10046 SS5]|nr:hypothetical protein AURDEDRAFT_113626 [Auricularia subglabra TFB-10046 SS5]
MAVFLTIKRSAVERAALARLLVSNLCAQHRRKRAFPSHLNDFAAQTLACECALFLQGATMDPPAEDARSWWPRRRAQFFPFGAQASVESILDWFYIPHFYQQHGQLLGALVRISRQRVLPVLMDDRNRPRLLNHLLQILRAAANNEPGLHAEEDGLAYYRNNVRIVACIFHAVMRGDRYSPCDEERFTRGYEAALGPAVLRTLHLLDGRAEQTYLLDLLLALHFRGKLPRQAVPERALARIPGYVTDFGLEDDAAMQTGFPLRIMLRYLRRMRLRVDCAAPGCGRHSHESTTGHMFPVCARCGLATYCSRACQKRDWAGAHRDVCDILRELWTFADLDMDDDALVDACYRHDFPVSRATRLTEWMASVPYISCISYKRDPAMPVPQGTGGNV